MGSKKTKSGFDVEKEVLRRYKDGAKSVEAKLCCPVPTVKYGSKYLDKLPKEILEKDYGCGNPSSHVREGEYVLDLGSGAGKICYILAQKVGKEGKVIGVDFNDDMLALSRKYLGEMADKLGYANVKFVKGRIQDLALDLEEAQKWLDSHPAKTVEKIADFEAECSRMRVERPMVKDSSVDVVVSNCVLNLVRTEDKAQLFREIFRVLKPGGRAVISDIVCDEDPTPAILADPELWSGCISGAFREDAFLEMFEQAGFYGIELLKYEPDPWQVFDGVEFRSVTVCAYKPNELLPLERNQAVIYKGPWKAVTDEAGNEYYRGSRMAVADNTYKMLTDPDGPYGKDIIPVPPKNEVPLEQAPDFDDSNIAFRNPKVTKGEVYGGCGHESGPCCCSERDCC